MPPTTRSATVNANASDDDNPPTSTHSTARPRPPPIFTGADVKTTSDVTRFLFQLGLWFTLAGISATDQVDHACTCLGGAALDWAIMIHDSIANFQSFSQLLKKEFGPANPSRAARTELWSCTHTSSLAEYTSRFRSLCLQVDGLSQDEQADRYLFGLKPHLRKELLARQANTFNEMTLLATSLDQSNTLAHTSNHHLLTQTPSTSSNNNRPQSYRAAAISNPNDDLPPGPIRKGSLTPELRAELLRLGGCFYCRQLGHLVANCPTKPAPKTIPDQGNALPQ
jgi:hypothetical protein